MYYQIHLSNLFSLISYFLYLYLFTDFIIFYIIIFLFFIFIKIVLVFLALPAVFFDLAGLFGLGILGVMAFQGYPVIGCVIIAFGVVLSMTAYILFLFTYVLGGRGAKA